MSSKSISYLFCKLALAVLFSIGISHAQTTALTFRPVAAEYSLALDRIVMVSTSPNMLHIYDPGTNADVTVALPAPPLKLSLSPDGLHAAVASANAVDYVNLQSQAIDRTFPVTVGTGSVTLGNGYFYILPAIYGTRASVNVSSGVITSATASYEAGGRFNAQMNAIYGLQNGLSPNDLLRYDVSAGPIASVQDSPYHGEYSICGDVWFSPDGSRIYTGCGTIFRASSDTSQDMRYVSSLAGLSGIQAFTESAAISRIAAVPQGPGSWVLPLTGQNDSEIRIFDTAYLNYIGRFVLNPFVANSSTYAAHGRYVFFDSSGTNLYAVIQADSTSGLLHDFAIQKFSMSVPGSCSVVLSNTAANIPSSGSVSTMTIVAAADCEFQATSNSPWLLPISGYYGSGNTTLVYQVRPNSSTTPRVGTISVAGQTLTVSQDGATGIPQLNPLSYTVVAADYSKSLDRLVLASGSANELHLYDPVTGGDQFIALPAAPVSVSVRPDGNYAAVGHNGWVSYVNLQSLTVEQVTPILTDVHRVILAGNGYIYVFPLRDSSHVYSLHVGDAAWIVTGVTTGGSGEPRLHASGNYIYVGGSYSFSKWDISNGSPQNVTNVGILANSCGNLWLTEDGQRLITGCGGVFRTTSSTDDLSANGTLSETNSVTWAAHSIQQHQSAVIPKSTYSYTADDTTLQFYGDASLSFMGEVTLPGFSINSTIAGHGRFAFWNSDESKLVVLEQADSSSALLSDYAVYTLDAASGVNNCSYQLSTMQLSIPVTGATGMPIVVTTGNNCGWTADTSAYWLTITSGHEGSGSGAVNITASGNFATTPRTATLTIAGKTVQVSQPALACTFIATPGTVTLTAAGGNSTIKITAPSFCSWFAMTNTPWITLVSGWNGSGTGTLTYRASANLTSSSRNGSITVGGNTVIITQASPVANPQTGLHFIPIPPCRAVDTRLAGSFLAAQTSQDFSLSAGDCTFPAGALAYSVNVTVVPHGPLGWVTVWPAGETRPMASTVNSYDGRVRANAAIIPAGQNGRISVFATDDTEIILDVNGYFVQDSASLAYFPVTPCRVVDTRLAAGPLGGPTLASGQQRTLPLLYSECNIPPAAQAYSLNYTVVPHGPLSYLTTWPTGLTRPKVSTLNAPTGATTANAAIIPAGNNGSVDVFATDETDLIVDITGYFAPPISGGLSLYPMSPCRIFDTRETSDGQPPSGVLNIAFQGTCNLPPTAHAYAVNATVVPSGPLAYLTLWPSGDTQPGVSTLNSWDGSVTANMAIVTTHNGVVSSFVSDPTHLILDVTGYFAP